MRSEPFIFLALLLLSLSVTMLSQALDEENSTGQKAAENPGEAPPACGWYNIVPLFGAV